MPTRDSFGLPTTILDAAMARLLDVSEDEGRQALAELVAAHPEHASGLQALAATLAGTNRVLARTFTPAAFEEPREIEHYRVLRRLGDGAFGIVYLCEQVEPIHRQVAVKVLRPGAGDRGTLQRFDAERRFLARLNHPTIAQIFDAGLLPDGRPWFVMEQVAGVPITQYCDRAQMPVDARLRLFARLCQGVQHAHEQGIVHRDLKPANVLVVEVDGEAQPKIIDFGIARALEHPDHGGHERTETGRVVGTPGYMSPEQAASRLDEVDARSDTFSLGVMLYELLTGEMPWGRRPDTTDFDPPRPSQRIVARANDATTAAEQRGSQPRKLAAALRGELDWIALKALSREREQRYATALELAADLQRHLRGAPVHAGPPSLRYRLRKFVRRRRTAIAVASSAIVMVAAGAWLVGAYRSEAQDRALDAESAVASLIARANDKGLVTTPGAEHVRESLAQDALAIYERFLRDDPADAASREGRSRTLWTLSQVYWRVGRFAQSEQMAREAVADGDALLAVAPDDPRYLRVTANAERNLGRARWWLGRKAEARVHFERAIELLERSAVTEPAKARELLVRALLELNSTLDDVAEVARCVTALERAAALQEEQLRENPAEPDERDSLVTIELHRAQLAAQHGDADQAAALLARGERWIDHRAQPSTITSVHAVAAHLAAMKGDMTTAIERMERAIATIRGWVAQEPGNVTPMPQLAGQLDTLIALHASAGNTDAHIASLREAVEHGDTWLTRFPEEPAAPPYFILSVTRLDHALLALGRRSAIAGAEAPTRRACELLERLPASFTGPRRSFTRWSALATLGMLADALDFADAGTIWDEAVAAMRQWRRETTVGAADVAMLAACSVRAARRLHRDGRDADATVLLDELAEPLAAHAAVPELAFHRPPAARLRARLALRRGGYADAAAHAEAAAEQGADGRALAAAADAMTATWQAASRAGAADATRWRDRALALAERAIDALAVRRDEDAEGPWVTAPLARMQIHVAVARRDLGEPFDAKALTNALDELAALRADMHADEWDEPAWLAGKALLAR